MEIHCPHYDKCSGCTREKAIEHPTPLDDAKQFFKDLNTSSFKLHVGVPTGWRCRAKLAVRGTSQHPLVGLFEKGSHDVVDIPFCQVHHPAINRAADTIRHWIQEKQITPYDEKQGTGLLRYIQLAVERSTKRIQLVVVVNTISLQEADLKALEALWYKHPDLWHSLWINFNTRRDNVIVGLGWQRLFGEHWLWETLRGREVCFHPASFVQANLDLFEDMLDRIAEIVPINAYLVEYYAGVGAIGLSLAERCSRIQCFEIVPTAFECFERSMDKMPFALRQKMSFITGSAGTHTSLLKQDAQVVIVDPPRKGLEVPLLKALCAPNSVETLIYVSCCWESFKRDCKALADSNWRLESAEAYLFFPGSDHLEVFGVFKR